MDENIDRAHIAWPIVDGKDHQAPSVFRPEALLREARKQRRLPLVALPEICIPDPDGDIVRHVKRSGAGPHVEEIIGAQASIALHRGATWTTDAPYRETASAIQRARLLGALAVEMEAAALYAFSTTSGRSIVCFAHVTNSMAQTEGDFEKGEADGAKVTLAVIAATARAWHEHVEEKQEPAMAARSSSRSRLEVEYCHTRRAEVRLAQTHASAPCPWPS